MLDEKLMFEQLASEIEVALKNNSFNVEVNKLGLINFNTNLNVQDIARIFDNIYSNIIKDKSNTNIESNGI